jgi:hypothetical protein
MRPAGITMQQKKVSQHLGALAFHVPAAGVGSGDGQSRDRNGKCLNLLRNSVVFCGDKLGFRKTSREMYICRCKYSGKTSLYVFLQKNVSVNMKGI